MRTLQLPSLIRLEQASSSQTAVTITLGEEGWLKIMVTSADPGIIK